MKYFYWWLVMVLLGLAGLVVIVMFESITLNNDSEYYVLKEAMEAAMLESVDIICYNITKEAVSTGCDGQLKIVEQKFVENFTRRFASTISGDVDEYEILFYDIIETPPKASVVINSTNKSFNLISDSIDIKNGLTGILEAGYTQVSTGNGKYEIDISDPTRGAGISVGNGGFSSQGSDATDKTSVDDCEEGDETCADPEDNLEGSNDACFGNECDE